MITKTFVLDMMQNVPVCAIGQANCEGIGEPEAPSDSETIQQGPLVGTRTDTATIQQGPLVGTRTDNDKGAPPSDIDKEDHPADATDQPKVQ